ncbi:MAG: histidine kinase [Cellvibrionales bacterium]|nr:histidine kinase [Cellvibrionales bacterium]
MQLTIELTMYPFQQDYLPPIKALIAQLNTHSDIQIQTFPTATILTGEHSQVMQALDQALRWSTKHTDRAVFIAKLLPNYQALPPT